MKHFTRTLLLTPIYIVLALAAHAGPVLDDLLNYAVVDQRCPQATKTEGMGLASQQKVQWIVLSKEQPLGQTFRVSDKANVLWRVTTGICHWPDSWQEGEEVTFTLYDSPTKDNKLYSRTLDFDHKWFKWDVCFDTHTPTKPEQEFYFELTHNGGGDNRINVVMVPGDDYKRGRAYVAGQPRDDEDLYFVAITKAKGDREENLRRLLSLFDLGYPPLAQAKRAYDAGDLDGACTAILRHFETRTEPDSLIPKPMDGAGFDTTRADQICDENRIYHNPKTRDYWMDMSDQKTWREVWPNSADYIRQDDVCWILGQAYHATGNEKYAAKINDVMLDWMQDYASPFEGGMNGAHWVAMHVAWRLGDAWYAWGTACKSKSLTDDVKLGWIGYWGRMAHFAQNEHSGGNHANAVGEAMMAFGHRFPEYKQAQDWQKFGFDKLMSNSLDLFRADGGCKEPTMNYHGFSLSNLLSGLAQAEKYGMQPPKEIFTVVENALAYTTYMLEPNGQIPALGDTNMEDFRPGAKLWDGWRKGEATKCYRMFDRKDALWIATAGKQGERPKSDSYCFPQTGHYILRSDWGGPNGEDFEHARYLFFRAGKFGSHGHWDLNGFQMYAYGRPLIIDPGRTDYDSPLMPVLTRNTSHNVLLVDDQPMQRVDPSMNAWHTTPVMDLVDCTYAGLYKGVDHRRAIVFVRPDYYVMFDRATADAPHDIGINFWLTPPDVSIHRAACTVNTNEPGGSNVLLKVSGSSAVEITERKGTLDLGGDRSDIPVVTFRQSQKTQADFETLLYPYPAGAQAPRVASICYSNATGGDGRICIYKTASGVDTVFWAENPVLAMTPTKALYIGARAQFNGRSAVIRQDGKGQVTSFGLIDGTLVYLGERLLAKSSTPVHELSVRYLPDRVEVTCPKGDASLTVASLGRKRAVVNEKAVRVEGNMVKVF